ncbi:hypothetical protein [Sphingomonas sp.]|uniref:hypothetical protein n=1 Tax=Sphingomonas sp. TaxID=28214 RepID=UPI0038ABA41F
MKSRFVARTLVGLTVLAALPGTAFAQAWTPGSEIVGQPIQVTTNGVTNTVTLVPGGQATITTAGGRVVNGTWTAANGQLCLGNGVAQECVPYAGPFQAGTPMAVTSSCGASETWLASSTNVPPPTQGQRGERGR